MILLSAGNIIKGGGINVLNAIILELEKSGLNYIIIIPKKYPYFGRASKIIRFPEGFFRHLFKLYYDFFGYKILKKHNISEIISVGNVGYNSGRLKTFQTIFVQNAFIVASKLTLNRFTPLQRIYLTVMQKYYRKNIKYGNRVFVQSQFMKRKVSQYFDGEIGVISNTYNLKKESKHNWFSCNEPLKLLYLTSYYPHKNFEIFTNLGSLLSELNISLTFTLPKNRKTSRIIKSIKGSKNNIQNLGPVPFEDIDKIYSKFNGIISSSILESFSGNLYEGLFYDKIMFLSDLEFNREIMDDNAFYFDPFSSRSLKNVLTNFRERGHKTVQEKLRKYPEILKKIESNYSQLIRNQL